MTRSSLLVALSLLPLFLAMACSPKSPAPPPASPTATVPGPSGSVEANPSSKQGAGVIGVTVLTMTSPFSRRSWKP